MWPMRTDALVTCTPRFKSDKEANTPIQSCSLYNEHLAEPRMFFQQVRTLQDRITKPSTGMGYVAFTNDVDHSTKEL